MFSTKSLFNDLITSDLTVSFHNNMKSITLKILDENCCKVSRKKCKVAKTKTEETKKCTEKSSKLCDNKNSKKKLTLNCAQWEAIIRRKASEQKKKRARKWKKAKKVKKKGTIKSITLVIQLISSLILF